MFSLSPHFSLPCEVRRRCVCFVVRVCAWGRSFGSCRETQLSEGCAHGGQFTVGKGEKRPTEVGRGHRVAVNSGGRVTRKGSEWDRPEIMWVSSISPFLLFLFVTFEVSDLLTKYPFGDFDSIYFPITLSMSTQRTQQYGLVAKMQSFILSSPLCKS